MKTLTKAVVLLAVWSGALHLTLLMPGGPVTAAAWAEQHEIVVRVLLYSGRPDPEYSIENQGDIVAIRDALSSAKVVEKFDKATVIPSILGYKGILVKNTGKLEGLPSMFAVYQGMIEVTGEPKRFLSDGDRRLEKLLIDGAMKKGVIDDALLKRFNEKM